MAHLRLFLLRHGQTLTIDKRVFNGWTDIPLSPLGEKQLDDAVNALKGIEFTAIYSSDLQRARYGAEILAAQNGLEVQISKEWREMNFGECEGLDFDELEKKFPVVAQRILNPNGEELLFPGGESDRTFMSRIAKALANLCDTHTSGTVCIVSHAGVGRAVIADFMQLPFKTMWTITQNFACLNVFDVYPDGYFEIKVLNAYLGPEGYYQKGPGWSFLKEEKGVF